MTSRIKAIRDRHRGICLIHSQRIHAIHTLYARTFPHRLMTYQVSYCIYIAATVEALELKSPLNQGARQAAAARLAAAVRILQNEASHTPGSGKSLDTIRRLLSAGQRTPGVPQDQNSIRNSDSTFVQHSIEDANANAELCTNLGDSNADEIPNGQPGSGVEPEVPIAAGAIQGQPEEGNGGVITGTVRQPTTHHGDDGQLISTNADQDSILVGESFFPGTASGVAWDDGFGIYRGTDTGAGFHPDAFPWRVSDLFPRMPNLAGQDWDQGWAGPASSPRDSANH